MRAISRVFARTPAVVCGAFRAPNGAVDFATAGQVKYHEFVFPRTGVVIAKEGQSPFVGTPDLVTLYNPNEPYERRPWHPDGDRCDWFAVEEDLFNSVALDIDERAADRSAPRFERSFVHLRPDLLVRQRRLAYLLRQGKVSALFLEEAVLSLLRELLIACASPQRTAPRGRRGHDPGAIHAHVLSMVSSDLTRNWTLLELAAPLGVSPFVLSRGFAAAAGTTLHRWLVGLRLIYSLEAAAETHRLLAVAHRFGFPNHGHYTASFRRWFGTTPSAFRQSCMRSAANS